MTTLTIHYQSPKADPLKVPRPHRVAVEAGRLRQPTGGEVGALSAVLGFTKRKKVNFAANDWCGGDDIAKGVELLKLDQEYFNLDRFTGWYAAFIDMTGYPVTYTAKIERLEVSE